MDDLQRHRNPQPERFRQKLSFEKYGAQHAKQRHALFPNCKGVRFMKKIAVIIPSHKNRQWYERNLSSVVAQDYHDFRVIYVDDCSSDRTGELVEQFIADGSSGNLIHLIRNPVRIGALQNLYNTLHMCDDDGRFTAEMRFGATKKVGRTARFVAARDDPDWPR